MYKVIIVDDEKLSRDYIEGLIDKEKYDIDRIDFASNGKEGLNLLKNNQYDVAIIDIMMPIMNGIDLVKKINEDKISVKCVVISGVDEFEYARQCISLGVKEYLLKPFEVYELEGILSKLLSQKEYKKKQLIDRINIHLENEDEKANISKSNIIVKKTKEYVELNFGDENLSIKDLAGELNLNENYVRNVFKKKDGTTLSKYIRGVRMEKAKEMLQQGNYKHSHIGYLVGYNDPAYFSKSFKKYAGMSPKEYELIFGLKN